MVVITAAQILLENNYTTADISATNLGYLIDNAIDYVNLEAGTNISNLVGGTVTVTSAQAVVLKPLIALMLRAYKEKGPQVGVAGLNVMAVISDPHYSVNKMLLQQGLNRLRGRGIYRT